MTAAGRRVIAGLEVITRRGADAGRPEVLFLHGNWMGAFVWDDWAKAFAARGVTSHALSYPGHGGSPAVPERAFLDMTAPDLVAAVAAVRAALGSPGILIGHSLGGLVAQALAARDGAAALVLIASAAPAGVGPPRALRPADRPTLLDPAAARALLVHDPEPAAFERCLAWLGPGATGVLNSSGGRLIVDTARVRCPVLVVAGERDASSVPPGPVLAAVYGARCLVLPETGHTPMVERRGAEALDAVLGWLDRVLAPDGRND